MSVLSDIEVYLQAWLTDSHRGFISEVSIFEDLYGVIAFFESYAGGDPMIFMVDDLIAVHRVFRQYYVVKYYSLLPPS